MWAEKGSRPTAVRQTEYEWCYLWASVDPATGDASLMITPTVNTHYMNAHLRFVSRLPGADEHAVIVLDQAGWHVARALKVPTNITLLHLPSYTPELNPAERIWHYLRSHYLSNRVYPDYDALFDAVKEAANRVTSDRFKTLCAASWVERMN